MGQVLLLLMDDLYDQAQAVHLSGLWQAQHLEHGGGNICQAASFTKLAVVIHNTERNRVGGVRSKGGTFLLKHFVRVSVV